MNLSIIMCFRPGCSSVDYEEECLSLFIVDLCLMSYKCPPSALTTCRYGSGTSVTDTRTDTWGVTPCAYSGTYNTFFIYNSKQQCLVKTRCFRGGTWWVSKAWLAVLDRRGHLNRASQGERSRDRERDRVSFNLGPFAVLFFSPALSSRLHITSLSFSSPAVVLFHPLCLHLRPGSCDVLAHAGSQQQSALLRDFRVFHHALPQPLFLPIWVHPVYHVPVALALRGEDTTT